MTDPHQPATAPGTDQADLDRRAALAEHLVGPPRPDPVGDFAAEVVAAVQRTSHGAHPVLSEASR